MASPQIEDGHIDIANTIADKLCSYRLSGQEWQIVWAVLRKTWGWLENINDKNGPKKKMDRIALSQFAEMTGMDRRRCHASLKKLIDKNIILKSVTQIGDGSYISYGFQKDFDLWVVSPKKVTVTKKDTVTNIGDKLSPKKTLVLSPKKTPTKETLKETTKENPLTPKGECLTDDDDFPIFWKMYGKIVDKKKCEAKWKRISKKTKELIFEKLPAYVAATPDKQFRKNPSTWLNSEGWNDELPHNTYFENRTGGKRNGKAKNYTGPDTRDPILEDRMPEY